MGKSDRVPPKLYKYQPFTTRTLANLKKREVWFSRPTSFNDPFDCALSLGVREPSDEELDRLLARYETDMGVTFEDGVPAEYRNADGTPTESLRRGMVEGVLQVLQANAHRSRREKGVTCFSESPNDLLLWAHYGGGHAGFCMEFDTNTELFNKVHRVMYSDELPKINILDSIENPEGTMWRAGVLTKARCWAYEREWRAIHQEPDRPFTYDSRALTGVYLGAMMDDVHREIIALILRDSPTQLYTVRVRPDEFALDVSPFQYAFVDHSADDGESGPPSP